MLVWLLFGCGLCLSVSAGQADFAQRLYENVDQEFAVDESADQPPFIQKSDQRRRVVDPVQQELLMQLRRRGSHQQSTYHSWSPVPEPTDAEVAQARARRSDRKQVQADLRERKEELRMTERRRRRQQDLEGPFSEDDDLAVGESVLAVGESASVDPDAAQPPLQQGSQRRRHSGDRKQHDSLMGKFRERRPTASPVPDPTSIEENKARTSRQRSGLREQKEELRASERRRKQIDIQERLSDDETEADDDESGLDTDEDAVLPAFDVNQRRHRKRGDLTVDQFKQRHPTGSPVPDVVSIEEFKVRMARKRAGFREQKEELRASERRKRRHADAQDMLQHRLAGEEDQADSDEEGVSDRRSDYLMEQFKERHPTASPVPDVKTIEESKARMSRQRSELRERKEELRASERRRRRLADAQVILQHRSKDPRQTVDDERDGDASGSKHDYDDIDEDL